MEQEKCMACECPCDEHKEHNHDKGGKEYVCGSCGSKSTDEAGTCCGGERKESCENCHKAKKDDGSCGHCG